VETVFLTLLILLMVFWLASGYPVAFALPGSAILSIGAAGLFGYLFEGSMDAYFVQGGPTQWLNAGVTNFRGIYWEAERDTLIAIPLFIFMGIMLERSKIAEDLLMTMAQLFGPIRGGLGISVVFVGALLAATTGIVGATVIAMGLISLPVMLRNNYANSLATGTIAAAGTLGQIIPPSIVLIILADQLATATDQAATIRTAHYKEATGLSSLPSEFGLTSTSAGDMFLGALLPGLVLVGLYMLYILILAIVKKKAAPAVAYEGKYDVVFALRVFIVLVPPLTLIFAVLGSIVLGIATVNQAGAIGAVGALIMAGYRLMEGKRGAYTPAILAVISIASIVTLLNLYDINIKNLKGQEDVIVVAAALVAVAGFLVAVIWSGWRAYKIDETLQYVMLETAKTTSLVFIILLGAAMLTAAFRSFGGEDLVKDFLTGLPGGFIAKFVVVMAVIFVLGFFLDFIEIAVVVVPIIAPILLADPTANVTAVWLGVMIGVNMQTSFLTPPFGFALFYLRGVAPPKVTTLEMYRGVVPFILLQLAGLAIVGVFPPLVNYLPNTVYLSSETAPPPKNPKLQLCLEEYLFNVYDLTGGDLRASISKARSLDFSGLPENLRGSLVESLDAAEATFDVVDQVRGAEAAIADYLPDYRPLHLQVRALQPAIHRIEAEIEDLARLLGRLDRSGEARDDDIRELEQRIERLEMEKAEREAAIPAEWEAARKRYVDLAAAEKKARRTYRRNVDDAYEPIAELRKFIAQAEALAALETQLRGLSAVVATEAPDRAIEIIKGFEKELGAVDGISHIRSKLSRTRRALKGDSPDRGKASAELGQALERFTAEVAWRRQAQTELAASLEDYNSAIKDTIGVRSQERLNPDQAGEVAACLSVHRDISLSF
jgi:tripartite ATP-independent transporter DctM subunit